MVTVAGFLNHQQYVTHVIQTSAGVKVGLAVTEAGGASCLILDRIPSFHPGTSCPTICYIRIYKWFAINWMMNQIFKKWEMLGNHHFHLSEDFSIPHTNQEVYHEKDGTSIPAIRRPLLPQKGVWLLCSKRVMSPNLPL